MVHYMHFDIAEKKYTRNFSNFKLKIHIYYAYNGIVLTFYFNF